MGKDIKNFPEQVEKKQSKRQPFQLSRRAFLGGLAGVGAAALGWYLTGTNESEQQSPVDELSVGASHVETPAPNETVTAYDLTVHLDEEGVPLGYQFPGEEVSLFDDETRAYLREQRLQIMQAQGEPEPAIWFQSLQSELLEAPTPEKPYVTELPNDVLSEQELAEYGITIINTTNEPGASTFFLRKTAFSENGVLEALPLLKKYLPEGESLKKVRVVSLNTEYIPAKSFLINPGSFSQLETIFAHLREDLDQTKQNLVAKETELLEQLRSEIADAPSDEEYRKLFEYKAKIDYYHNLDDYTLLAEYSPKKSTYLGAFFSYQGIPYDMQEDQYLTLFMTAPEFTKMADTSTYTIGFDNSGKVLIDKIFKENHREAAGPRIDQSYLSPAEIGGNLDNPDYTFEPESMGFIACHEFVHYVMLLLSKLATLGKLHESKFFQNMIEDADVKAAMIERDIDVTGNTFPVAIPDEEKFTDIVTKMVFKLAYKRWKESNFTDDSGYNFAFQIPPDGFQPGGVQITHAFPRSGMQQDMAA